MPAPLLKQRGLELLVFGSPPAFQDSGALNRSGDNAGAPLVPMFDMLNSTSGRMSNVLFPTHLTIFFGTDINGICAIASVLRQVSDVEHNEMVRGVASIQWTIPTSSTQNPDIWLVNLGEAERAIKAVRKSPSKVLDFEETWARSGLASVTSFLSTDLASPGSLKPAFRALIHSVLAKVEDTLSVEEARIIKDLESRTLPEHIRSSLTRAISTWAEAAHTELRDELEDSFNTMNRRKLAWWKLPWRVDDVGLRVSDTLRGAYLNNAENGLVWVYGRIQEAGLLEPGTVSHLSLESQSDSSESSPLWETSESMAVPSSFSGCSPKDIRGEPWPHAIADSRARLIEKTLPPLQATAQSFLFQALLTTSVTSTLSVLLYLGDATAGVYEAGAVGAAGLAWSAWHLQTNWDGVKRRWIGNVIAEGRSMLSTLETRSRLIVKYGGRPTEDVEAINAKQKTREAVERVRVALESLE